MFNYNLLRYEYSVSCPEESIGEYYKRLLMKYNQEELRTIYHQLTSYNRAKLLLIGLQFMNDAHGGSSIYTIFGEQVLLRRLVYGQGYFYKVPG